MNNPPEQKPQPPRNEGPISGWDILRVIMGTLLVLLVGVVLMTAVGYLESLKKGGQPDPQEIAKWASGGITSLPLSLKIIAVFVQAALVLPAFWFLKKRHLPIKVHMRIHGTPVVLLAYAFLIGLAIAVVGDEMSRLVNILIPMPKEMMDSLQKVLKLNSLQDILTMGLTVAIIAPLGEELLFRGFFQRYFETKRGVTSGVLATSAIFAAYHFNLYWLIPILIMATIMGAMAWRAESILPSFIVHAVNNTAGLVAANGFEQDPGWYVMGEHVSPWIVGAAIVVLIWSLRNFFRIAENKGLGGHGPSGDVGSKVNTTV